MSDMFKCSCCKGVYKKAWSDVESLTEFAEKYPNRQTEKTIIVCENCVHIVDAAEAGATPEELKRLIDIRLAEMTGQSC